MAMDAEVAVVGLGAMGSAALYQLAKRGVRAVGIDRFAPPHAMGSSGGETRITRQAVGEGASYVPLVLASHRIWRELEAETAEELFEACGILILGPASGRTSHHGRPDFVGRSAAVAREFGIRHETLDGAAIGRRFPHLTPHGDEAGYFEPGGGFVRPERCIAAQLGRARELGADIRAGATVRAIVQEGDGVRVETDAGPIRARQAIVAAGAWTGDLLGPPFDALLGVYRQVLYWFALDGPSPAAAAAPVFIWMHGAGDGDYVYGFPQQPGETSVKVASEQYERTTRPDDVDRAVSAEEAAATFRTHVAGRLAGVSDRLEKAVACLYTVTPDGGFVIDRHPAMDRVTVVSACSGHGFKHSAGIGEALAEGVATGRSRIDLSPFSLARFGSVPRRASA